MNPYLAFTDLSYVFVAVSAFFASPLSWIFDDPANTGWNEPDGSEEMLGNGFAW